MVFASALIFLWHANYSFELEMLVQQRVRGIGIGGAVLQIVSNFPVYVDVMFWFSQVKLGTTTFLFSSQCMCEHTHAYTYTAVIIFFILTAVPSRRNFFLTSLWKHDDDFGNGCSCLKM